WARSPAASIVIGAAAVADYRAQSVDGQKRKRNGAPLTLALTENPDIMAQVGATKKPGQFLIGFAAETHDLIENATAKLRKKQLDLVVANEVGTPQSGFGTETLRAAFVKADGAVEDLGLLGKDALAER